jgi:hypothetical protein
MESNWFLIFSIYIYIYIYLRVLPKNLRYWIESFFFTWYQNFNNQVITSLNITIFIYLIKIKHKIVRDCTSFKVNEHSIKGVCVIKNNINHILEILFKNLSCWVELIFLTGIAESLKVFLCIFKVFSSNTS